MHRFAVCLHVLAQTLKHPVNGDYNLTLCLKFPPENFLRLGTVIDKGNVYRVWRVESRGNVVFSSERCTEMVLSARGSPRIPRAFRDSYTSSSTWTTSEGRNYWVVFLYCYTARLLDSKPQIGVQGREPSLFTVTGSRSVDGLGRQRYDLQRTMVKQGLIDIKLCILLDSIMCNPELNTRRGET